MLTYFVVIPVLIASLLFVFSDNKSARVLAIILQTAFTAFSFYLVLLTRGGDTVTIVGGYIDFLGIYLRIYSVSAVFMLLTSIIFLVVAVYSFNMTDSRTFWFLLFILEAALTGLYFTRDLFNIFVLVEVSTVVVIILLMFNRERRQMFGGMVFLMLNIVAMQFYLLGLAYVYKLTGAFDIAYVSDAIALSDRADLILPYALIMTAIAFKCSIIPLFSFTPKTQLYPAAPCAVAAILSGVQIKTNVYLFIRLQEVFGSFASHDFFLVVGIAASITGVILAISQTNIKMILAYHTMSQVGLIIIGLSSGGYYSQIGGLYHVVSHGIFKSALFLTAGIIYRSYGTCDVYKIKGVLKRLPLTGVVTLAAVLGITGAPLFIGSVSKYFISYDVPTWLMWTTNIISLGTIISFIKYSGILFGKDNGLQGKAVETDKWRIIPTTALGIMCLAGGVFGQQLINFLFDANVSISLSSYLEKSLIFFASLAIGYLIYKYAVKGNQVLKRLANLNFSFKSVCMSMGVFFGLTLIFVGIL
ncbi:MAG: proton-conducting membrane transporter [Defluviitaleaceae bacterium]|nr:proton-conducting membrane transporter [Defluviitaleaceae bacterium]